ncbi:acyltransferase [Bacillus sp. Hm123]|uniref:acyltransferase n=1 Tax=Bacillus sp. Hm123 TaxID=3450745 RepID=UPI003F43F7F5
MKSRLKSTSENEKGMVKLKKEILSIYYLRVFAMLFVVFVHTTAQYRHLFEVNSFQHQLYNFLNTIVRVEAGIFIMLVGIVFFYIYRDKPFTPRELLMYGKKRFIFILVPYIIWSFIYEIEQSYYGVRVFDIGDIWERLLTGDSKYQLHFIYLVVQFYLILPIVIVIVKRSNLLKKYLWVIGIAIEFFFHMMKVNYGWDYFLFIDSFGAFLLGGWIGLHYEKIKGKLTNKKLWISASLFVLTSVPYVLIRYQNMFNERVDIPESLYKLLSIGFYIGGSFFFFYMSEKFTTRFSETTTKKFKSVASYSFGFYLLHPLVLYQVMNVLPTKDTGLSFHVMISLQYIVTVILCYLIIWFVHSYVPFANYLFGKLPKKSQLVWRIKSREGVSESI